MLIDNNPDTVAMTDALTAAYTAKHPDVTFEIEQRSGRRRGRQHRQDPPRDRRDGGHLPLQLRLAVPGATPDPDAGRPVRPAGRPRTSRTSSSRWSPRTARSTACRSRPAMGGGIFYNTKIYEELGLSVPKTWDEFMANNEKIKAAGKVPIAPDLPRHLDLAALRAGRLLQRAGRGPDLRRRLHRQQGEVRDDPGGGDAASSISRRPSRPATSTRTSARRPTTTGCAWSRPGEAAHYPMLTFAIGAIQQNYPDELNDVGFFAQPGQDAAKNGLTVWMPAALYIPAESENVDAGEGLPRLRRLGRGLRRHDRGDRRRPARTWSRAATCRPTCRRSVKDMLPYFETEGGHRAGARVPLAGQGPGARADHRRGRLGHPPGRRWRGALRPGRREAGQAARAAGLVTSHIRRRKPAPGQRAGRRPGRAAMRPQVALSLLVHPARRRHLRASCSWCRPSPPSGSA